LSGEVLVSVAAALLMVELSRSIDVDPLDRVGQVSGLASLALRFTLLGLLVLAIVVAAAHRRPWTAFPSVSRLACAAVAGLATGMTAGGLVVALRGTSWPLYADHGDSGRLAEWAGSLLAGGNVPAFYPPAALYMIAWLAELTGSTPAHALKMLQVLGTALFGPVAYLSWRLLLPPPWALCIGLVGALPLIDPYKPYVTVVLVALLPVVIRFLQVLRGVSGTSWSRIALYGMGFGSVTGFFLLSYSGWFVWSALGVVVATLLVFPWRTGVLRGLGLLGATGAVFAAIAGPHLVALLGASGTEKDRYFSFDTFVEPAYIAMWRSDLPGEPGPWPPPGELAGVGLFTVLLVVGAGIAVALGRRHTAVLALCCCMASAWLLRFWFASQMYETQTVQLYPRTTQQILYCLLLLSGFGVYLTVQRFDLAWNRQLLAGSAPTIGVLCAMLLFALSAGSSVPDRYMPRADNSAGQLAYVSQMVRQEDGRCPAYSRPDRCAEDVGQLYEQRR